MQRDAMNFFFHQRKMMNFAMHLTEFCLFTTVLLRKNKFGNFNWYKSNFFENFKYFQNTV